MATDRFTKSPASRKRMSELISRIGKDESQDAGDFLTDEALEDLPEEMAKPRGSQTSKSREMAFADEPTIQEVPEGVEYRTEDSAGGAARPLGEIGGYGRVDEEAFSKMLDEAEPFSFEDEKKLVAQQVAAPESFGTWEGGGGYTYTHVTDAPGGPYIMVEKEGKSPRRVVPGTKGIGGSDMYGRILAEKTMLDVSPRSAKAFYESLPPDQRRAIEAAGNVDVPAEDGEKADEGEKADDAGEIPVDLRRPYTFYAEGDAGEIPVDLRRPPEPAEGESAPKTSEAGEPLPKPAESQKADNERVQGARGTVLAPARLAAEAAKYGVDLLNPSKEDQGLVAALKLAPAAPPAMVLEVLEENGAPPGLLDYVKNVYFEEAAPESGEDDGGPRRGSSGSGTARAEPRRGTATAPAEDLEFYQGIGEAADITPAGGDRRVPTVEGQLTPEDLPLAANITPSPAGTAMVEPRRGDLDTSSDLDRALADTGTARKVYREAGAGAETGYREGSVAASPPRVTTGSYGFEATAQDFMAFVGSESRKAPPSVKAAGDEAVEFFVLAEYVSRNGGTPEDMELAQYFAEKGDSNGLLEVLDNLPANVTARAARTGGM